MKTKVSLVIIALASMVISAVLYIKLQTAEYKVEKYKKYHIEAEKLIDRLDVEYDWVDAIDPYEYYIIRAEIRDEKL